MAKCKEGKCVEWLTKVSSTHACIVHWWLGRAKYVFCLLILACSQLGAQGVASISGKVLDPTGAAVPSARVTLSNAVTRFSKQVDSQADGSFSISNIPFQTYQLVVEREGFVPAGQTLTLRSTVPA